MAARKKTTEETEVTTETVEIAVTEPTVETTPKRRGGRKASPLTVLIRDHEKALAVLARAEARWEKVANVEQELKDARSASEAASAALREALGTV